MGRHRRRKRQRSRVLKKYENTYPSRHHRLPTSRGGKDFTIQMLPCGYHQARHFCFHNLTQSEIHKFIDILYSRGSWNNAEIDSEINRIKNTSKRQVPIRESQTVVHTLPIFYNSCFLGRNKTVSHSSLSRITGW
jgi:hypothetical protein